jgi:CBS domain-containing protein
MKVRGMMTGAIVSVSPMTPVAETRRLMREEHIRHVLVLDGPRLVGIVTDRDIRLNLPSPATTLSVGEINYILAKLTVGDVMTSLLMTIGPDHDVYEAARLMIDHKIGCLPVMEDDRVVGIITETDLLRALVLQMRSPREVCA